MRTPKGPAFAFPACFLIPLFLSFPAQDPNPVPAPKKWLEEDVNYIITAKEREVFLALRSDKERETFQRAFWAQRDPTPGTPANEFREEHYRRLKYADDVFGRGTVKRGRDTDRGRIYIILGPPVDIQRFHETSGHIKPAELWQYSAESSPGLPAAFYLLFFEDQAMSDLRLYSPSFDGPQRLLQGAERQITNRYDAYMRIKEIDGELAEASLSLIPGASGDPTALTGGLSSDILIANIHRTPEKTVRSDWARAFARHSAFVSTDYSVNFIESHSALFVHKEEGKSCLHALIEPSKLSFDRYEEKVYAPLKLNYKISTPEGGTIHQEEKSLTIEMTMEDFKSVEGRLVSVGDIVPLAEGDFGIDLLLRNTNANDFSSAEGRIAAPPPGRPALSPVLFLWDEKAAPEIRETVPFLFHGRQLFPNARRSYSRTDHLVFYIEMQNPSETSPGDRLRIRVGDESKTWFEAEDALPDRPYLIKRIPLQAYPPGYYRVTATWTGGEGKALSTSSGDFAVAHLAVPRPWPFHRTYPPLDHAYFAAIRARQYLALDKNDLAILEIAPYYDRTGPNAEIAKVLARANFQKRDYPRVLEILDPLGNLEDFEIQELAGKSFFALKEYPRAVERLKIALTAAGDVIEIINLIGYSCLEAGRTEEALKYFERSLGLFSDQPKIRDIADKIRKGRRP